MKEQPDCSVLPTAGVQGPPGLRAAESPIVLLNINLLWLSPGRLLLWPWQVCTQRASKAGSY